MVEFSEQLHGDTIVIVNGSQKKSSKNNQPLRGDALITDLPGKALTIRIADCLSLLVFDPQKNVIANIHAGWRGIAARIIKKTIQKLHKTFRSIPEDLLIGISPSIGPCCFNMSNPIKELPVFMRTFILLNNHVDLWAAAESQLIQSGVRLENIENQKICTACNNDTFYSYRKDDTERFYTAIMLTK